MTLRALTQTFKCRVEGLWPRSGVSRHHFFMPTVPAHVAGVVVISLSLIGLVLVGGLSTLVSQNQPLPWPLSVLASQAQRLPRRLSQLSIWQAQAQELSTVQLTEVMPAPSSGGKEWVELHNAGAAAVPLAGWYLEDVLAQPSTVHSFGAGTEIAAGQHLVVELDSKLNNSGDGVTLFDSDQQVQDAMNYGHSVVGQSWSLIGGTWTLTEVVTPGVPNPGPSPISSAFPTPPASPSTTPSPGASASPSPQTSPIPTPVPSPTSSPATTPSPSSSPNPSASPAASPTTGDTSLLSVTEIMACPESGELEWLELHNAGPSPLALNNWKVVDGTGNSRVFSATLAAGEYRAIEWTGSLLNNAGDTALVVTNLGVIWFSAELDSCSSGYSWVISSDGWHLSDTPTPSEPNPVLVAISTASTETAASNTSPSSATSSTAAASNSTTSQEATDRLAANLEQSAVSSFSYPGQLPNLEVGRFGSATPSMAEPLPNSVIVDLTAPSPSKAGFGGLVSGGSTLSLLGGWAVRQLWLKLKPDLVIGSGFPLQ